MSEKLSHEALRDLAMRALKRYPEYVDYYSRRYKKWGGNCAVVLSELTTAASDTPDAIGWSMGMSILIEVKVSRSDFFADAKKPHRMSGTGAGEFRYFLVPDGLVEPHELPEDWGLLYTDGKSITVAHLAPRRDLDCSGQRSEKQMLLSTIRRIRTREFLMVTLEPGVEAVSE